MPRSTHQATLSRQWEMLFRLPTHGPGITASRMKEILRESGFEVSKRTVERDLIELSRIFQIRCNDESTPYGWFWKKNSVEHFGSIELTDAVSLNLSERLLRKMLPAPILTALEPKFSQAQTKLSAISEQPMAKLTEKVRYVSNSLDFRPPHLDEKVLLALQEGLVAEKQIEATYASFEKNPQAYCLHPLSLIQRGTVPYLIAHTDSNASPLIFAIHRFETATVTERPAEIPEDYSVDQFIEKGFMEFGEAKKLRLTAELTDSLATYLSETPISEDQEIRYRNGSYRLKATVRDTWQLHFWILSQGPEITIRTPKSLRERISESASLTAANYNKSKP